MSIKFGVPNIRHPSGDDTLPSIALKLESRFGLVKIFSKIYQEKIKENVRKEIVNILKNKQPSESFLFDTCSRANNDFKRFLLEEEHGIKTKSAKARQGISFIDTRTFFRGLVVYKGD